MRIDILASTKINHKLPADEALILSGMAAGVCYLPDSIDQLLKEPVEKTTKRYKQTLNSMHHSVFGHPTYSLVLSDIPKILAMVLNNEKAYNASEKSARYTKMTASNIERPFYEKWLDIFKKQISTKFQWLDDKKIAKIAQENARYLLSIFTPSTTMVYTTSLQQLNYLVAEMEVYRHQIKPRNPFEIKLGQIFANFSDLMKSSLGLIVDDLNPNKKGWQLSLFANRARLEEFGENYSVNYLGSFAQLAQAQRHRTLSYEISIPSEFSFYTPEIILHDEELSSEWQQDMRALGEFYPQGMMVEINERGTAENFKRKCQERLCGATQLEIARQTHQTLLRYLEATKVSDKEALFNDLLPYPDDRDLQTLFTKDAIHQELLVCKNKARCQFLPNWHCDHPCSFGSNNFIQREI